MKFSPVPKLIKEELKGKDLDAYLEKFLAGYNSLLEQQQSLWSSITLADNLKSKTWDFNNATGTALSSKTIAWPLDQVPTELRIARLQQVSGTALTSAPWLEWSYSSGQITFKVKGLVAASTYNIRLIGQV